MKRYTGQGYTGHKFSSGDPPLHPVGGVPATTWKSNCEVCGKEFTHHENKSGHKICSKECRKAYKKLRRQRLRDSEQSNLQGFLESLVHLSREDQIEKLLRYDSGKWFHKLSWLDEIRGKSDSSARAAIVVEATVTPTAPSSPQPLSKPKHDWAKLQAKPAQARRQTTKKRKSESKNQLNFDL